MNKDLKNRIFDIPQDVLDQINSSLQNLNGQHVDGVHRAKKLLLDKKVKYGQLKRIIHDINSMDKKNELVKYNLCGGERMENWSKQFLQGERDLISNNKDSRKRADDIGGLTGDRKNSHLEKNKFRETLMTLVVSIIQTILTQIQMVMIRVKTKLVVL